MTNTPTKYILLAGNNVNIMSTGNLFANKIVIDAGVVATATTASVGGLTNQTVNRLWNVDTGAEVACCFVGPLPGNLTVDPTATGNVVNEGSVSARGLVVGEYIAIQAKGNVRSGIAGNTSTQIGLYSDLGIYIDSYSNTSTVELYNVVSGYSTNKTLPFLYINTYAAYSTPAFRANVIINAVKPGAQPSSITTTDEVMIFGGDVTISSTINHMNAAGGGVQNDVDLYINASKTLNVNANIGAGQDVILVSGGNMSITGNVLSDTNSGGYGGIYIYNNGLGATTTISGNLTVPSSSVGQHAGAGVRPVGHLGHQHQRQQHDHGGQPRHGPGQLDRDQRQHGGRQRREHLQRAVGDQLPVDRLGQRDGRRQRVHRQLRRLDRQRDDDQRQRHVDRRQRVDRELRPDHRQPDHHRHAVRGQRCQHLQRRQRAGAQRRGG